MKENLDDIILEEDKKKVLKTDLIIIDLFNIRYKLLYSFLYVFKIGEWKHLPEIISVEVTKIEMSQTRSHRIAISSTNKFQTYSIFLRTKRANIRIGNGEKDHMLTQAKLISKFLNQPLVDHTK